ncbi:SDR family NAD(P)-dependent oxidoreductase [Arthrobacter sp. MA-N2]|uniref:SDR family NAD(P)-dependent oxidoreductase n=1 Tax=Arthrobacter sp. MA-N2 TaxID=1101188 RepID=UPI0004BCD321|nr:SDR family NAD(P)-dependent oxidoreductase [Arthrobacter sp. MA-N2]
MNEQTRPVALITGAAGDIGQATAVAFARRGYDIAVFDRLEELLAETVSLCEAEGAKVHAAAVNQTDFETVRQGVADAVTALGRIDALFANAGYGKMAELVNEPLKEWQRHVDVNLNGTYYVAREAANAMIAQGEGGAIVLNASSGASQYSDLLGAYCITKAGVKMLSVGLASELGTHRIRVNSIEPGVVETGMTAPMLSGENGETHRQVLGVNTPVGRLGAPEDVAELVAFLASNESAGFITGVSVPIDGGQVIHGHPQWYATDYRNTGAPKWEAKL